MIEIKLDPRTLPRDGQRVRFKTEGGDLYEGHFTKGENIFTVDPESRNLWFFAWHVDMWEAVCGQCGETIVGRTDMKFCGSDCRNTWHNNAKLKNPKP